MTSIKIDEKCLAALAGKVAVMTGTSSGIGLATVELFLSLGAHVVAGDINPPKKDLPGVDFVKTDVSNWDSQLNLFDTAIKLYGKVDFVFANAGITSKEDYLDLTTDADGKPQKPTHETLSVNLAACIDTVLLGIFHIRKNAAGGSIVVTASTSSYQRFIGSDYATAKHGVLGYMRSMVDRLHPNLPIRINGIAPSWTDTGMIPRPVLEVSEKLGVQFQTPRDVALSVAYLAVTEECHGHVLHSSKAKYQEVDIPILKATYDILKESDGDVMLGLRKAFDDPRSDS